jgi:hypothetical protein
LKKMKTGLPAFLTVNAGSLLRLCRSRHLHVLYYLSTLDVDEQGWTAKPIKDMIEDKQLLNILERQSLSQPLLSFMVKQLLLCGLLEARKTGKTASFRVNRELVRWSDSLT